MNEEKCFDCEKIAKWIRHTQFCGDHFFCKEHAKKQEDFKKDDSYAYWTRVNRK
jgi:hypothetical protein